MYLSFLLFMCHGLATELTPLTEQPSDETMVQWAKEGDSTKIAEALALDPDLSNARDAKVYLLYIYTYSTILDAFSNYYCFVYLKYISRIDILI